MKASEKTSEELVKEVAELRRELFTLIGRVRRLEDRIEVAIEAPPIEKRIVPSSVVGAAGQLGEELAEGRRIARQTKESARSLRRALAPEEDTGSHDLDQILADAEAEKKK